MKNTIEQSVKIKSVNIPLNKCKLNYNDDIDSQRIRDIQNETDNYFCEKNKNKLGINDIGLKLSLEEIHILQRLLGEDDSLIISPQNKYIELHLLKWNDNNKNEKLYRKFCTKTTFIPP